MKLLLKFLPLVAVVALAAPFAKADQLNQISFTGTDSYAANGDITFADARVGGTSTGIFSAFLATQFTPTYVANTVVSFTNFNANSANGVVLFNATAPDGETLSFTITSSTLTQTSGNELIGGGYYTFSGTGHPTPVVVNNGTFDFTTQNGMSITFSDTNSITPEPSSLMLLGTGLVSAAGMLVRRRRNIAA